MTNDNEQQSVWMVDRNTYIQEFNLKVENPEQTLSDILAASLPENLKGKIGKLTVQMVITR